MQSVKVVKLIHILVCCTATVLPQSPSLNPNSSLNQLVNAERSFARTSVEKGVRASFIEFFADDGINFQPHPTKTKEAMQKGPVPTGPPRVTLNWEPVFAEVSRSGDLGYTTGPYTLKDNSATPEPTRHGYYFSVWKKQDNGEWKVVVDCGISTPDPAEGIAEAFHFGTPSKFKATENSLNAERLKLLEIDRAFGEASASKGLVSSYASVLTPSARMHRNGMAPLIGKKSIMAFLAKQPTGLTSHPIKSDVATSSDLGYTYGSYEVRNSSVGKSVESGYYVRVWKRGENGIWSLVLDTTSPLPETK
jgi:ketosteroid isomerase-like protein